VERKSRNKSVDPLLMCEMLCLNSTTTLGRHFKTTKQPYLHFTVLEFSLQMLNILFSILKLKNDVSNLAISSS